MKIFLPRLIITIIAALIFLAFAMISSIASYGSQGSQVVANNFHDSIIVEKRISSKGHRIALYPDAMHKVLFFTVKGEGGKVYQLYVFDIDGRLVKQREIRNKQTTYISEMEQGVYLFDVFCDDERIGRGQIAVRSSEQ